MKKIFLLLVTIMAAAGLKAQLKGTIRLYAYQQPVVGGRAQQVVNEDGTVQEKPGKPRFNYLVYTNSASAIIPEQIWIKGEAYKVTAQAVSTPVELGSSIDPYAAKKTLVPKTTRKVLQLSFTPLLGKKSEKGERLSKTNEVVLIYGANGKKFYQVMKTMETLEPAYLQ